MQRSAALLAGAMLAAIGLAAPAFADECIPKPRTVDLLPGRHAGSWPEGFTPLPLKPKEVVLTFDDGPNPAATPIILKTLKANCLTAMFFPTGINARSYPDLVKHELADGHVLGGHTWDHAFLPDLSFAEATKNIERGLEPLRAAGADPKAFRFPQLAATKELLDWLARRGLTAVSADIDPSDWAGDPPAETLARLKDKLREKGGGIVILHDSQPNTARLLPSLIEFLRREGYSIVTLMPGAAD